MTSAMKVGTESCSMMENLSWISCFNVHVFVECGEVGEGGATALHHMKLDDEAPAYKYVYLQEVIVKVRLSEIVTVLDPHCA